MLFFYLVTLLYGSNSVLVNQQKLKVLAGNDALISTTNQQEVTTAATSGSITFKAWTSGAQHADTNNQVFIQFMVNNEWTNKVVFFTGAQKNSLKQKEFSLGLFYPTAVRLSIKANNGWGYSKLQIATGDETFNIAVSSSTVNYGNNQWWIDGDQEAPKSNEFDINAGPGSITFKALTSSARHADTTDQVFIQFMIYNEWTNEVVFFTGAQKNTKKEKEFSLVNFPTAVRLSIKGNNAWGYSKLQIVRHDEVTDIAVSQSVVNYGDNIWWIDGNQQAPASNEFSINSGSLTFKASTSGAQHADTSDQVFIQFMVNDQWTNEVVFFTGATQNAMKQKSFSLSNFPTRVRLSIKGNNAWGYSNLQIIKDNGQVVGIARSESIVNYGNSIWWIDGNQQAPKFNEFSISDHPWCEGNSGAYNVLVCMDLTQCQGWDCCTSHGGRGRCPSNLPFMCAKPNSCGGGTSHCCSPTVSGCEQDFRGLRYCPL